MHTVSWLQVYHVCACDVDVYGQNNVGFTKQLKCSKTAFTTIFTINLQVPVILNFCLVCILCRTQTVFYLHVNEFSKPHKTPVSDETDSK